MDDRIIICKKDDIHISAVFQNGICRRIRLCREDSQLRIGDIYVGRVASVSSNVKAIFVSLPGVENVYIPFDKMHAPLSSPSHSDGQIHEGDSVLFQIDRLPSKNKPASGVADFSLVGNTVVFFHENRGLTFSKKIENASFREDNKLLYEKDFRDRKGLMFRTNAPLYTAQSIAEEIELLRSRYNEIVSKFLHAANGTLLYRGLPEYLTCFRDEYLQNLDEIVSNDASVTEQLHTMFLPEEWKNKVRLYSDKGIDLYHLYDLKKIISDALNRKVWLKSGANLVFDVTEAMTVIDVNSSHGSDMRQKKDWLHSVNMEAAEEILHQLELRNISGIVIVDFINTDSGDNGRKLLQFLREKALEDRGHTTIVDMTKLGLAEITREKHDAPLYEKVKELMYVP